MKTIKLIQDRKLSFWLGVSIFGIVVYILIDVLLAFLRPGYSLIHNAESDYGRGPYFWLMDINFLLRCFFSLALVKALLVSFPGVKAVKRSTYWLSTWAIASGLLAFFADNPSGYKKLPSGSVHLLLAFIAFISVVVGMILLTRSLFALGLARVVTRLLTALTIISVIAVLLLGHAGIRPHALGGLYERIFLGAVLLFELVIALALRKPRAKYIKLLASKTAS